MLHTEQPVDDIVRGTLSAAAATGGPLGIVLTFLNSGVVPLWEDYQLRVAREQRLDALLARTAVVSWDEGGAAACRRHGLAHCVFDRFALSAKQAATAGEARSWEDHGRARHAYCRLMWRRLEVMATAVWMGIDVLLIDVDILLFQDPLCLPPTATSEHPGALPDPHRTPADIYVSAWGRPTNRTCPWAGCTGNKLNSGFILARSTARTIRLLNRLVLAIAASPCLIQRLVARGGPR